MLGLTIGKRPQGASSRSARSPSRQYRPVPEALDERVVPAITYHGGPIMAHVDVRNVFYGQGWTSYDSWGVLRSSLNQFQSDITRSQYMSMLGEYGVGRGGFGGSISVTDATSPAPSTTVGDLQIQKMLTDKISAGLLPPETGQQLYVVYLPANTHSNWDQTVGTVGHHGSFQANVVRGTTTSVETVYYAVITNPIGNPNKFDSALSTFQDLTEVTSHELAEAVTDPDLRQGDRGNIAGSSLAWIDTDTFNLFYSTTRPYTLLRVENKHHGDEIGDMVGWQYSTNFTVNGHTYTVQKEWSNLYQAGILPNLYAYVAMDTPPAPNLFNTLVYTGWNKGGRATSFLFAIGLDGRQYYNFVTATGDLAGWYTPA
jgi:hypothetical protein